MGALVDEFAQKVLLTQFEVISDDISSRYSERYKIHALSITALGTLAVVMNVPLTLVPLQVKLFLLLFLPFLSTVIMMLMLKEHQYINMRDSYIEQVIWPQIKSQSTTPLDWQLWQQFEQAQMGRTSNAPKRWRKWSVFALLGAADYALPAFVTVAALVGYVLLSVRQSAEIEPFLLFLQLILFGCNALLFFVVCGITACLRFQGQTWFLLHQESSTETKLGKKGGIVESTLKLMERATASLRYRVVSSEVYRRLMFRHELDGARQLGELLKKELNANGSVATSDAIDKTLRQYRESWNKKSPRSQKIRGTGH
jgi:hypothetical protein